MMGSVGLVARMTPPASKSETHRAFILAAMAARPCVVEQPLLSADCLATLTALEALGARVQRSDQGDVAFFPFEPDGSRVAIDCGNSATTLRLIAGQVARWPKRVSLGGDRSLCSRPHKPLWELLETLGARVEVFDAGRRFELEGPIGRQERDMEGLEVPADISSQYASSLVLSLAMVPGPHRLRLREPISSAPYLQMTLSVARDFGLHVVVSSDDQWVQIEIEGGQRPLATGERNTPARYGVERDWSSAAFPLVAAALLGQPLQVLGLRRDSAQGDRAIVDQLRSFGGAVRWGSDGSLCFDPAPLRSPGTISLLDTPDLFPPLCVLAACSSGVTRFQGGAALRHKESDRIAVMASALAQVGIVCQPLEDGLIVEGGTPHTASVRCHGDHRVQMALSVLSLATPGGIAVDEPGCVDVSFPGFHAMLDAMMNTMATERKAS